MTSIVVTEIKGSILRHRLFDRLAGRRDIVAPEELAPSVIRHLLRFLVAGLDDGRSPGSGGWPVFTGGRYAKLCFSPVIDPAEFSEATVPYRLPVSELDYVSYVGSIIGIGAAHADELARIFRFDPAELFHLCRSIRADRPEVWRLLLSNEFQLARQRCSLLDDIPNGSQFRFPLVDAFRIIADFERASLIMRHMARARSIIDRPRFLDALTSSLPLSTWFKPAALIEVYRWIEYITFSSAAMTDLLFDRDPKAVGALPAGYAPWAFARGELPSAAASFHDDPEVRKALVQAFTRPAINGERRKSVLRNDEAVRWYGLTSEVLPIVALDDARTRFPTRRGRRYGGSKPRAKIGESSRIVLAQLGSAMRTHADPAMQRRIVGAAEDYLEGSKANASKDATLEANTRLGLKLAFDYLPAPKKPGSAARFDPMVWNHPKRDADLWHALIDPRRARSLSSFHPRRGQLVKAMMVMRRAFTPAFAKLKLSPDVERVVCDMAFALSPISVDPHIAFAIHALGQRPSLRRRKGRMIQRRGYGR
ncbi:hypothetical protein [Sphingomonas sp.]|uniref:hypothetical protein n=1 Tax=Sphingomonas sp. TaxID=28214 RepID=UPI003B00C715